MTEADPLEVAAWQMATGSLASEKLPDIATDALVRGLDSPALRMLAGQLRNDVRDSADLFRTALEELGIDLPDVDTAQWCLARLTAADIVAGRVSPGQGATNLWLIYLRVMDSGDLRIFVGLGSELDDHPEDEKEIAAQIISEAQALLDRPAPRRWIKLIAVRGRSPVTQTAGPDDIEVDPAALRISDALRTDLVRWAARFAEAAFPPSVVSAQVPAVQQSQPLGPDARGLVVANQPA